MRCTARQIRTWFLALLAIVLLAPPAASQELPKPTVYHQQLARDAGVWEAKVSMWPTPDAPAVESTATETNTMLGGFWLLSEFQGDFQGSPLTGRAQLGYDTETGEYVSTWIDSISPILFVARGEYDVATHTLTLKGEGTDWMTGERKQVRMVTTYRDERHKLFEIHEAPVGSDQWWKSMQIEYTKR